MLERDLKWVYESERYENVTKEDEIDYDDDHDWLKEGFVKD